MVGKRRATRFLSTTHNSWTDDFIYRREPVVYRNVLRWWLTAEEVERLVGQLADTFDDGRYPRLSLWASKVNKTGGHFRVRADGTETIRIRGTGMVRCNITSWGVDSRCREVKVVSHGVAPFLYPANAVLHEFAHVLAWRWWADGSHHGAWAAVDEALHEWFARKRGRKGTAYRVTISVEKVKVRLG